MNSIFRKQLILYMGSLIISFLIITMVLMQAFSSYFISQKKEVLTEQGEKIVNIFKQAYYFGGIYDKDKLNDQISILDDYLDASFIYIDSECNILMISNDISKDVLGERLETAEASVAVNGMVVEAEGTMGGLFDKTVISVGYPINIENRCIGAIFLNSPMTELQNTLNDTLKILLLTQLAACSIGFILLYISSRKIIKPILQMNEAAKVISSGDFERRLEVKGMDEVAQLANSFNEMAESLYEQDLKRREFLSNISHDLRSPLTSMKGFLQAIMDGTIPEEKQNHYLNIVLDESERLATLANNILDISKLEADKYELKLSAFDINELIRKTVYNFEARLMEKNISLDVTFSEEKIIVYADYEKVQRIIYNLIDNSVKFTDEEGKIYVESKAKEKAFISVKDNGRGISKEEQKKIFERFYKSDASRGEYKTGSGLGLSIVKAFIKAHGENITVKSEPLKGCEFIFTLPLAEEE